MARLLLHVTPGARDDAVVGWRGRSLHVKVRARPERGRANEAVLRLLSRRLDVPRASIDLVRGVTSREKLVEIEGLSGSDIRTKLGLHPR